MRSDIIRFIRRMKMKYGIEAIYIPENDVYSLRLKGRVVQNFNSKNFYDLPRRHRDNELRALIKIGLNHNLGEKIKDSLYLNRTLGKKIA